MKIFYNGRVIDEAYARFLEDNGQAHTAGGGSGIAPDGSEGGWMRMERGPGNNWLEKQPPEKFLTHVFGHTSTWGEMATRWAVDGEYAMEAVAQYFGDLNHAIVEAMRERQEPVAHPQH